jgi:hypothetical protein
MANLGWILSRWRMVLCSIKHWRLIFKEPVLEEVTVSASLSQEFFAHPRYWILGKGWA